MNKTIELIKKIFKNNKTIKSQQKNRSKVNYSNKKIRPQKGTGKARISTKKSPIFIGGGRSFPSYYRIIQKKINKKMIYYCIFKQLIKYKENNKIIFLNIKGNNNYNFKEFFKLKKKYNKLIIIYKKINNIIYNKLKKYKKILIKEDKINPINIYNKTRIFIINNAFKWIKKF